MTYLSIFILSFALSVDACVVSFSYGLVLEKERYINALLLALFTSLFQGIMPVIGYYLTNYVKEYVSPYADLIVFLIFMYLGIKFILEAFEKQNNEKLCIDIKCLFLVGIATSIDAFGAGISLSLYGNKILKPAILITSVTFMNSLLGFWFGGKLKKFPTRFLEVFAGMLLIFLAVFHLL